MKKILLLILSSAFAAAGYADSLLVDNFNTTNLATFASPDVNGGANQIGTGTGSAGETATVAQITSSSNPNDINGLLSKNSVNSAVVSGNTQLVTTWNVSNSDIKSKSSQLMFTWQTSTNATETPEIGVLIDMNTQELSLFTSLTNVEKTIDLDASFGALGDAFELIVTFSDEGYRLESGGTLLEKDVSGGINVWDNWSNHPDLKSFSDYYVGAIVKANGTAGLVVDIDSLSVETIPEPAVLSLIGVFGGGIIFFNRIRRRDTKEPRPDFGTKNELF